MKNSYLMYGLENVANNSVSSEPSVTNSVKNFHEYTPTYFTLTANSRRYYVVKRDYDVDGKVVYLIGNNVSATCVMLSVDPVNSEAILQTIAYYDTCGEGGDFNEEKRDTVNMVLGLLHVAIQQNKALFHACGDIIKLKDTSHLGNVTHEGQQMPTVLLADYYKLTIDQTWYEKHFGAVPNPSDEALVNLLDGYKVIHTKYDVSAQSFNAFWSRIENYKTVFASLFDKEDIHKAWKQGGTIQDFMGRLKRLYKGPAFFSVYMQPILVYLDLVPLESSRWHVPIQAVADRAQHMSIALSPQQQAGGKVGDRAGARPLQGIKRLSKGFQQWSRFVVRLRS